MTRRDEKGSALRFNWGAPKVGLLACSLRRLIGAVVGTSSKASARSLAASTGG